MSKPFNDPTVRQDSVYERPFAQSTRLLTFDFETSSKLAGTTSTVTSASATIVAAKSVSTLVLGPLATLQPTLTRLNTPPHHDMADKAETQPQTTTTALSNATTSATTSSSIEPPGTTTVSLSPAGTIQRLRRPYFKTDSGNADAWLLCFKKYAMYRGISDADKLLAVLLRKVASDWYDNLDNEVKIDWTTLKDAFKQRFEDKHVLRWRRANELHQRVVGERR